MNNACWEIGSRWPTKNYAINYRIKITVLCFHCIVELFRALSATKKMSNTLKCLCLIKHVVKTNSTDDICNKAVTILIKYSENIHKVILVFKIPYFEGAKQILFFIKLKLKYCFSSNGGIFPCSFLSMRPMMIRLRSLSEST